MNGYERVKAALAGKPVDKRPVMMHNFQQCVKERGITFNEFNHSPELAAESFIRNAEKYDLDGILIDFDTATLAGACGCEVTFFDERAAVASGHPLKELGKVSSLKPVHVEDYWHVQNWLETSRRISEYFDDEKYVRCNCDQAPFSLASMLRGPQDFMIDLLDEDAEDDIFTLLRYCQDVSVQFINLAAQTGAHCVSNGDSVAGPAMISPDMYRHFAKPFELPLIEAAHENNVDYMLHICGNTTAILDDMKTLPTDALELDYKTDIKKMHDALADTIAVSGTVDPSGVLLLGTEKEVRSAVRELIDTYHDSTRLILCSGCALSPDTPEANIYSFIDEARNG